MRIAVASRDGKTVSGHIGKCAKWTVFEVNGDSDPQRPQVTEVERVTLPKALVFHHYKDDQPHLLGDCTAVIGASAGESFVRKMAGRGIAAVLTAETDPKKAVRDYAMQQLSPPKPRPIGELVCKVRDALSGSD